MAYFGLGCSSCCQLQFQFKFEGSAKKKLLRSKCSVDKMWLQHPHHCPSLKFHFIELLTQLKMYFPQYRLPIKIVFNKRLSSVRVILQHRSSSIKGRLPSKVVFCHPRNGVEFHQKSIGAVRCSLATSYDDWRHRLATILLLKANWNWQTGGRANKPVYWWAKILLFWPYLSYFKSDSDCVKSKVGLLINYNLTSHLAGHQLFFQ